MATSKKSAKAAEPQPGLRILQLNVSNVKRIVAVDIHPDGKGGLVIVGGKNGAGKSSVIDAIAYALGGKKASKDTPKLLRDGTDEGFVRAEMGMDGIELVVTRTWKSSGTDTLEVTTRDGHKLSEKQSLLDTLIGPLSFDPAGFLNMKSTEQLAMLLSMIDLPFNLSELNAERDRTYTERTDINRQLKSAKAIVENLDADLRGVVTDGPDLEAALAERAAAEERSAAADRARQDVRMRADMVTAAERNLAMAEDALTKAMAQRAEMSDALAARRERLAETESTERAAIEAHRADDLDALNNALALARQAQGVVGKVAERDRMREQAETFARESEKLTVAIDEIDKRKADGLAAANMPVPGLGFDDNGVTFNGLPLAQASGAEGLRVSVGIAMAKNPTAKIILSRDGSLLDGDNLAALAEMAEANGLQVWLERVGDGDANAIVIEAGMNRYG